MKFIHFYQPSNKIRRPDKRRSSASNFKIRNFSKKRDNPVACEPSNSLKSRLEDFDLIEYFDLANSSLEKSFHPSPASVLDSKNVELHTKCKSRLL